MKSLDTKGTTMNNPFSQNSNMKPASQVPMSQIDATRAQTGNAGMPSAIPMSQTAAANANPTGVANATANFGGGNQSAPQMPTQAYGGQAQANRPAMPAQAFGAQAQANRPPMPQQAGGQRPAGLPTQAAPQAQANFDQRQQRLAGLPQQVRARLSQNVMQRIQPALQQAEQRMQQMRASNASPAAISQAMAQIDQMIAAQETAVIDEYFGQQG
jgi:hypothetical protein